jgi:16S rRNA (uracil1498-N3)-methyltransferase
LASRIYVPLPLSPGLEVDLPAGAANHLRVLRIQAGQALVVFNGEGGEYAAELITLDRKQARVRLAQYRPREAESPLRVTLVQGISKGERMDFTVQKAVELGVAAIAPVFTERSVVQLSGERLDKREQHWRGVAIAACEQCGRNRIPQILPTRPLNDVWGQLGTGQRLVLDPQGDQGLGGLQPQRALSLLIGPEGGLTEDEVATAAEHGFLRLRLGPRVLRTETAGIAALAALQALHGDL